MKECLPEICSLDCGTMNFGNGNEIYISTPPFLREMAALTKKWGVKPELEVFDLGHIRFAKEMINEGLIDNPPLFQICLGIPWGAGTNCRYNESYERSFTIKLLLGKFLDFSYANADGSSSVQWR